MKKTNLFISLACALVLVAVMVAPAMAAPSPVENPVGASVVVNSFISVSIGGPAVGGMVFGSLNPGGTNAETHQTDTTGAIILTVEKETNVHCDINIKGDDFATPPPPATAVTTFAITNATYSESYIAPPYGSTTGTAMSATYPTTPIDHFTTPGTSQPYPFYHWLTVPAGQVAGTYGSAFYYNVSQSP